ncbi:hypothetical protein Trydic_g9056 [Trypoxylus dichotomus]
MHPLTGGAFNNFIPMARLVPFLPPVRLGYSESGLLDVRYLESVDLSGRRLSNGRESRGPPTSGLRPRYNEDIFCTRPPTTPTGRRRRGETRDSVQC